MNPVLGTTTEPLNQLPIVTMTAVVVDGVMTNRVRVRKRPSKRAERAIAPPPPPTTYAREVTAEGCKQAVFMVTPSTIAKLRKLQVVAHRSRSNLVRIAVDELARRVFAGGAL